MVGEIWTHKNTNDDFSEYETVSNGVEVTLRVYDLKHKIHALDGNDTLFEMVIENQTNKEESKTNG